VYKHYLRQVAMGDACKCRFTEIPNIRVSRMTAYTTSSLKTGSYCQSTELERSVLHEATCQVLASDNGRVTLPVRSIYTTSRSRGQHSFITSRTPCGCLSWFSPVSSRKCRVGSLNYATTASFPHPLQSIFTSVLSFYTA
jgi:hypothetical protein